jgi:hypothetical protein
MKEAPYGWAGSSSERDFDDTAAEIYRGKYMLVGVTYLDAAGEVEQSVQMHGVVESASKSGITISLRGERSGQSWTMPADPSAISPAQPGRYQLPETGEEIENPDFICTWMVQRPRAS